ncbi:TetR/AcrR family transcriptional regulator [Sphingobacterium sp. SRCM116780]|uniref:TetR/AcrR family transcriptional regulator n=1 Tax=Sphingobacterium sp. SRCM116780 TaxID=2907623 RepID=UPI001F31D355|nr:TetR/AcrR family transcriptional regulator [Sphingobacterium sp. SRCM116780]UIR57645.1 TetR/AcrR family transcriptional regulator [Sphingobacterium sp. SRCM116780]
MKDKVDLRKRILEEAKKLFAQDGYNATSIRKIAAKLDISPTTIYLYYKDKSDIVYALHQEGFNMMKEMFFALEYVEDPFERLKAIGKSYIKFAISHPDFYELMFVTKEPMEFLDHHCMGGQWEEGDDVFSFLLQTVIACQSKGYFLGDDSLTVALQAWTTVHGLCSIYISGHLVKLLSEISAKKNTEQIIDDVYRLYTHYMESTK